VPVHKLKTTDGFIVFDLDEGPAVGVVRLAPKVLRDGAELLARSTTYAAALFGAAAGGGSAGLNSKPEGRDEAIAAFTAEVSELVESGRWLPGPGVGVAPDDLASLPAADRRAMAFDETTTAESAVAAALGVVGSLEGKRVAIVGGGPLGDAAAASATTNGATTEPGASLDADCDVLLVTGKAGVLEHDLAMTVRAKTVVPLSPVPVTARAFAILSKAGTVVVPDFLALAAPLLAVVAPDAGDPLERVHSTAVELADRGTGLWMAAVERAEDHLRSTRGAVPFGRPLA
jgi:glutamate dehydrogenase/leucine dehydrogenase